MKSIKVHDPGHRVIKVDIIWHRLNIKKNIILIFFLSYVIFLPVIQVVFGPIKFNYSL